MKFMICLVPPRRRISKLQNTCFLRNSFLVFPSARDSWLIRGSKASVEKPTETAMQHEGSVASAGPAASASSSTMMPAVARLEPGRNDDERDEEEPRTTPSTWAKTTGVGSFACWSPRMRCRPNSGWTCARAHLRTPTSPSTTMSMCRGI